MNSVQYRKEKSTDESTVSKMNEIISFEQEEKILDEMKKQLNTDGLVAFAFKRCKDGVWVSKYIDGEFVEKNLLYVIEGALQFYDFVESKREELENAVTGKEKDIDKTSEHEGVD